MALACSDKLAALGEASMPIRSQALTFLTGIVVYNMPSDQPFKTLVSAINKIDLLGPLIACAAEHGATLPVEWLYFFVRIAFGLSMLPTAVVCQDASLVNVLLQLSTERWGETCALLQSSTVDRQNSTVDTCVLLTLPPVLTVVSQI